MLSHLFGDIPSPALFGLNIDLMTEKSHLSSAMAFRIALAMTGCFTLVCTSLYSAGAYFSKTERDYRVEATEPLLNVEEEIEEGNKVEC